MSQFELAKKLNKPQSFVAKIEKYERRIDVIEFLEISHMLDVDPCQILRSVEGTLTHSQDTSAE